MLLILLMLLIDIIDVIDIVDVIDVIVKIVFINVVDVVVEYLTAKVIVFLDIAKALSLKAKFSLTATASKVIVFYHVNHIFFIE